MELIDPIEKAFVLNKNIPTTFVQQIEDGKLLSPERLDLLIESLDPALDVVRCLQKNEEPTPCVVQVTTRAALKTMLKEREAKMAQTEKVRRDLKPKQVELNWAISSNDLNLKLSSISKFLEKGKRVEILLANKKKQRKASPEEAQNVIQSIEKMLSDMEGFKELKPREGKVGAQLLMIVGKK